MVDYAMIMLQYISRFAAFAWHHRLAAALKSFILVQVHFFLYTGPFSERTGSAGVMIMA